MLGKDDYKDPKEKIAEEEAKKKEKAKKKEEELTTVEEVTDEQAEEIEKQEEEKKTGATAKGTEDIMDAMQKNAKTVDLNDIDEGAAYTVKKEDEGSRRLLQGFKMANIKIHLLSEDIDRLYTKKKYFDMFDIGVLSIHSANLVDEKMSTIFKKGARVHIETADMLCNLNKEERAKFREKIDEKTKNAKWKSLPNPPFKHHQFYEVDKDETDIKSTAVTTEDEDFNLDDLEL